VIAFEKKFHDGYKKGMPEPKATVAVTHSQLHSVAVELRALADRLELVADVAAAQPSESLAMYNWASVPPGLKLIRNFVVKAEESRSAAERGTPIAAGQLKPRSTAKKSGSLSKKQANRIIAEMKPKAVGRTKKKE
jgi:hypothetical protein